MGCDPLHLFKCEFVKRHIPSDLERSFVTFCVYSGIPFLHGCRNYRTRRREALMVRIIKSLESTKEHDSQQLRRLQQLKVKIEVICEAPDVKKTGDQLKLLS